MEVSKTLLMKNTATLSASQSCFKEEPEISRDGFCLSDGKLLHIGRVGCQVLALLLVGARVVCGMLWGGGLG